jgi:hypothetical protein
MDDQRQIDTVSPYEPAERQDLERQLENDKRVQQQVHATIVQEQRLSDTASQAGAMPDETDARIKTLEEGEQRWAGYMVQDQQAIDHWDREHPGWQYEDTTPPDDSIYDDGSADSSDQADDTSSDDGES